MGLMWDHRYARRAGRVQGSAIRELLKVTETSDFISFGGGLPAPEVFPLEAVSEASARILQEQGARALQYSTTEGYGPLRGWLAQMLSRDNLRLRPDNILITSGSQQALDLIGKLLVDSTDAVVVESPTYLATLQCWRTYGANFVSVPSDDEGMVTDGLPNVFGTHPRLVYCIPNFQNPRGVTMSETRRRILTTLSQTFDVPVVEDDPYQALRFEGPRLPTLMELDARDADYDGNVIGLGSFSKVLAPGLRVGWVVAARPVIEKLTLIKQSSDLHTATFNQMLVHDLASSGVMARHGHVIVDEYRQRRDIMLEALAENFPGGDVQWTRPQGGMFLWVTLPAALDAQSVLGAAIARKVAFVPGQHFHANGDGANTLRLNFSNAAPAQIKTGIGLLAEAVRETMAAAPQVLQSDSYQLTGR